MAVGGAVGGAGVRGTVVVAGAEVVAAGALVAGGTVPVRIDAVDVGETDGRADDALGLDDVAGARDVERAKKRIAITRTVTRLPATAARPRSTQRGPRRGGGMILVVSPGMPGGVWQLVCPRAAACLHGRGRIAEGAVAG